MTALADNTDPANLRSQRMRLGRPARFFIEQPDGPRAWKAWGGGAGFLGAVVRPVILAAVLRDAALAGLDRKSTRLNSSHT